MNHSETTSKLFAAMVAAQAEMTNPAFDSTNPFFSSEYVSLASLIDHTKPVLNKHGLAVMQFAVGVGGVETVVIHTSGEWASETAFFTPKDATPQNIGAATTYARRYGLAALVNVAGEADDDGNAASGKTHAAPQRAPASAPKPAPAKRTPPPTQDETGDPIAVHVKSVSFENFTSKAGKEMKRYIIMFSDGAEYKIIDEKMAAMAGNAKVHNLPVFYSTEQVGKFTNLVALDYAPTPKPADMPTATQLRCQNSCLWPGLIEIFLSVAESAPLPIAGLI